MRKKQIERVILHKPDSMQALTESGNVFYIEAIERKLHQSPLSKEDQMAVIDIMLARRELHECHIVK